MTRWAMAAACSTIGASGVLLAAQPEATGIDHAASSDSAPDALAGLAAFEDSPAGNAARKALVARAIDSRGVEANLQAILRGLRTDSPPGSRALLGLELARRNDEPDRSLVLGLGEALASVAGDAEQAPTALALIETLSRSPTREAVGALIAHLDNAQPALREAAASGLVRATGHVPEEGVSDGGAWRRWWETARWMPEAEWRGAVAQDQARRARSLEFERRVAGEELVKSLRRLFAATPEDTRGGVLVDMLRSPLVEARRAGFDLIMVSLLNAKPIGPDVGAAAVERLHDPEAAVRGDAARVVELLGRPDDAAAVMAALEVETDPRAGAALLRAASKTPDRQVVAAAARWLGRSDESTSAAEDALLGALKASQQLPIEVSAAVRAALSAREASGMSVSGLSLLLRLGESERVAPLLSAPDDAAAGRAAQALSEWPAGLDELLGAARSRPALFRWAASGVERYRPTAQGLGALKSLPAPSPEAREEALAAIARALPPGEMLRAMGQEPEVAARERLLRVIVDAPGFFVEGEDVADRAELGMRLARTRLERGEPAEALALLDKFPEGWRGPRVVRMRVSALACLNRLDDAWAQTFSSESGIEPGAAEQWAQAWLDGLEWSLGAEFAPAIAQTISARLSGVLTSEQALRLARLEATALARSQGGTKDAAGPLPQP